MDLKDITGYPNYACTRDGRVFSKKSDIFLKQGMSYGYKRINLSRSGNKRTYYVHRIVAQTFIDNPNPDNCVVNHKDGNKINNHVDNLEWCTQKQNIRHARDTGLIKTKTRAVYKCDLEGNILERFNSYTEAAKSINVARCNIQHVCTGRQKTSGGFTWKYVEKKEINKCDPLISENWKVFEKNYKISPKGVVISIKTNKILKSIVNNQGYKTIGLRINGKPKKYFVHRLVALTYIPNPNPETYIFVNHVDGNPLNNSIENLEWCSPSQNTVHAYEIGLIKTQKVVLQYDRNGKFIKKHKSSAKAANSVGMAHNSMSNACNSDTYACAGFYWWYENDTRPRIINNSCIHKIDCATNDLMQIFYSMKDVIIHLKKARSCANQINECFRGIREHAHGYKWKKVEQTIVIDDVIKETDRK